ncbi:MAG: SpoIID/LytB domain-containing protein [Acidimicrobiia bacterium]
MKFLRILSFLGLVAGLFPFATPAIAAKDDPWIFEGGGWGHGVGLSQFGALGQANDGRSALQILQHYYVGTSIASPLSVDHWLQQPDALKVGLITDTSVVDISVIGGSLSICQPAADCSDVDQTIEPGESWKFEVNGADVSQCRFREVGIANTGYAPCDAVLQWEDGGTTRLKINGIEYAHGSLLFSPMASGFYTVLRVGLEEYLYGLAEVPSLWPVEALKAQAIIGRGYAVATAIASGGATGDTVRSNCACHITASSAIDQAYAGWSKENPANSGHLWTGAVDATNGEVLTHPESNYPLSIAKSFYSSSNGGASENVEDVWGGTPLPWLVSVTDPWSSNPSVNPLARWTVLVSDADMASHLGWDEVHDAQKLSGPPGTLIKFTGKNDGKAVSATLNGTQISTILKAYGFDYEAIGPNTGSAVRVSPYIISAIDPPGFDDIAGNVFENAIEWLLQEKITLGCNPPENDLYCPNDKVTRGEMAVFISRAMSLPEATQDYFTDDTGRFYEGAANRLKEAGITAGCGGTNFCGDQLLSREQMAVFFVRILKLPTTETDYFIDDENSPYEDHINRIAEVGITVGCNPPTNNKFCPTDAVTRGQMAAFFKRVWGP